MALSAHEIDHLHALLGALRDEQLSVTEQKQLEALVMREPLALKMFVQAMYLIADLSWSYQEMAPAAFVAPPQKVRVPVPKKSGAPANPIKPSPASFLGWLSNLRPAVLSGKTRDARSWTYGLIGCLAASLIVAIVVLTRNWREPAAVPVAENTLPADTSGLGQIINSKQALWKSNPKNPPQRLQANTNYELVRGRIEALLDNGAHIAIEAPAKWRIESPLRMTLSLGRISAHVPATATGFTVVTPSANVVDVGTDFVVDVDRQGQSSIAVAQGVVRLALLQQLEVSTPDPPPPPREIIGGEAVIVTAPKDNITPAVIKEVPYDDSVAKKIVPPAVSLGKKSEQAYFAALHLAAPSIGVATLDTTRPPMNLGRQFTVLKPIIVFNFGAYDSNQNGLIGEIPVSLYKMPDSPGQGVAKPTLLAQAKLTTKNSELVTGGAYRYLKEPIKPVLLQPGSYMIVGSNYGAPNAENFTNDYYRLPHQNRRYPAPTTNSGGDLVTYGESYYGDYLDGETYAPKPDPVVPEANHYSAASFLFHAAPGGAASK